MLLDTSKIARNMIDILVEEAFERCDNDFSGTLSHPQFTQWCQSNNIILELFENVFASCVWGISLQSPSDIIQRNNKKIGSLPYSHSEERALSSAFPMSAKLRRKSTTEATNAGGIILDEMKSIEISNLAQLPRNNKRSKSVPQNMINFYNSVEHSSSPYYSSKKSHWEKSMVTAEKFLEQVIAETALQEELIYAICNTCNIKYHNSVHEQNVSHVPPSKVNAIAVENKSEQQSNTLFILKRSGNCNEKQITLKYCTICGSFLEKCRMSISSMEKLHSVSPPKLNSNDKYNISPLKSIPAAISSSVSFTKNINEFKLKSCSINNNKAEEKDSILSPTSIHDGPQLQQLLSKPTSIQPQDSYEGFLFKRGRKFRNFTRRYYILKGKFFYCFKFCKKCTFICLQKLIFYF